MTRTALKQNPVLSPIPRLDRTPAGSAEAKYSLNVVVVYEDSLARQWAMGVYERVAKVVGHSGVQTSWWQISDLCEPGVLAGAVSTALRADVVVVSIRAVDGLPLPFYVWVREWLPNRVSSAGALIALLPAPKKSDSRSGRVGQYLRAVAAQGRMDFLSEERELPN
jgi:hypothetical protein